MPSKTGSSLSPAPATSASPTPHQPAARPSPTRRRRLFALLAVVAVLAYASDQLTKAVALDRLADGQPRPFIGEFIRFKLIGNPGAALSLGAGNTWVMTAIAVGVLVAIVFVAKGLGSRAWALALGLLLGSALGNLTDRFVRPPGGGEGHVVDFIDYNRWFIGNVADIWIVGAAGLVVVLALLGIGVDGRRDSDKRATQTENTNRPHTETADTTDSHEETPGMTTGGTRPTGRPSDGGRAPSADPGSHADTDANRDSNGDSNGDPNRDSNIDPSSDRA